MRVIGRWVVMRAKDGGEMDTKGCQIRKKEELFYLLLLPAGVRSVQNGGG